MKLQRILVPTDFSAAAHAALDFATILARDTGAKLVIVYVQPPEVLFGADDVYANVYPREEDTLREMLSRVHPKDEKIPHEHHYLLGDPSHEIVAFAVAQHADLIVLGSHGRTGLSRMLMGSVAESVIRHASCPVLTVKNPPASE